MATDRRIPEGRNEIGNKFMSTTTDMKIEEGEQVLNRSVGYHISILKQRKFGEKMFPNTSTFFESENCVYSQKFQSEFFLRFGNAVNVQKIEAYTPKFSYETFSSDKWLYFQCKKNENKLSL